MQQLLGQFRVECAGLQASSIEGKEVLVQFAWAERIPWVQLDGYSEMDKPVVLECLPEVTWGFCRNAGAYLGDALQLCLPDRICFGFGLGLRLQGMAVREMDQRIGADGHGPEFFLLGVGVRVCKVVERCQAVLDVLHKPEETFVVDLVVENGVAWGPLLHELGKDPGFVGGFPVVTHLAKDQVAHGAALPEGNHGLLVGCPGLGRYREGDLFAAVKDIEVRQAVAAEFGIGGRSFGRGTLFSDDQLTCADMDCLVLK